MTRCWRGSSPLESRLTSCLEESNNDPLERFMTRWLEADGRRIQREDQRQEEDRRLQVQEQEH